MHSRNPASTSPTAIACAAAVALGVAACSKPSTPAPEAAAPAAAETTPVGPSVQDEAASALAARAQELKAQEIELELRRRELAAQQAAAEAAAVKAAASPRPAAAPRPAASTSATVPTSAAPLPPVVVPAGTQLSVQLAQACSTRTTPLGEPVVAVLTSDLVIDGRRVARAGAPLRGSVTEVTSGSRKVGAVPALKIDFTQLAVADGSTAAVNVRLAQKGPSEKGRDTAKIVGGTAAGAIIGHQIDGDHGSVIGGALGAAAGVAAAKHTGTEVELAAGSVVTATVRTAFEYRGK